MSAASSSSNLHVLEQNNLFLIFLHSIQLFFIIPVVSDSGMSSCRVQSLHSLSLVKLLSQPLCYLLMRHARVWLYLDSANHTSHRTAVLSDDGQTSVNRPVTRHVLAFRRVDLQCIWYSCSSPMASAVIMQMSACSRVLRTSVIFLNWVLHFQLILCMTILCCGISQMLCSSNLCNKGRNKTQQGVL